MTRTSFQDMAGDSDWKRYGLAAAAMVSVYLLGGTLALSWLSQRESEGIVLTAIAVDLLPAPAAEQIQTEEIAPGPEMEEADAPPPEPEPEPQKIVEDAVPPAPVQAEAEVPAPAKAEPKPEPKPEAKPEKPVKREVKKPQKKPPAPRTAAAPKAERIGRDAPSPTSGASAAAAAASYRATVSAHLQRYKRYPASAEANRERGTAMVSFTVNRNGRVVASRLSKSSGFAALDQETMDLIQRAQPLPAFPPEIRQNAMTFTLPYSFTR